MYLCSDVQKYSYDVSLSDGVLWRGIIFEIKVHTWRPYLMKFLEIDSHTVHDMWLNSLLSYPYFSTLKMYLYHEGSA